MGILAFRSFLIFLDDQATPLWKSLLLLSICFGSQPQEFLSRVHSSPVSLASEKRLFFEGLRNVFPVTHYWYERLGWFAFMLKNEGRGSTSGSLMVWLFCSGVVCGSVHVYWRSSALLQESVFKPERKRADLSSLSSMSTDMSTAPLKTIRGRQLNCFSILWAVILLYFHVPVNFNQKRLIYHKPSAD